jgi:hypothetical protein
MTLTLLPEVVRRKSVTKAADEGLASTTIQNDDELFIAFDANQTWAFHAVIWVGNSGTGDIKVMFDAPAGALISWRQYDSVSAGSAVVTQGAMVVPVTYGGGPSDGQLGSAGTPKSREATGNGTLLEIRGAITLGATAGNLQFTWAQNTANGTTTVKAGSYIHAERVDL